MNGVSYPGLSECGNLQKRYELLNISSVTCNVCTLHVIMFYVDENTSVHWSVITLSCSGIIANVLSHEDISPFVHLDDIMLLISVISYHLI